MESAVAWEIAYLGLFKPITVFLAGQGNLGMELSTMLCHAVLHIWEMLCLAVQLLSGLNWTPFLTNWFD